jgi:hypothetical protein
MNLSAFVSQAKAIAEDRMGAGDHAQMLKLRNLVRLFEEEPRMRSDEIASYLGAMTSEDLESELGGAKLRGFW